MSAQMGGLGSSLASDEHDKLDDWLAQPPVPTEDPLRWWIANQKLYPRLSRMAIDVHATPGMFALTLFGMRLILYPSYCG